MQISKYLNGNNFKFSIRTGKRPNRSHLTHALNHRTHKAIRWCTPSIDLNSSQVKNPYLSDTSISYESLGFPLEPSGIFKKIYDHAAIAYGADHTLFSVSGTTGSNFIVLRALSKQIPNLRILAERNIHKSVVTACEDYGINLIFLPANISQDYQLFMPNTEEEIFEGVKKTKPQVLLLTNPTYEGFTLNLRKIISYIRKKYPSIIIFVDEAWGAHLPFSDKLPLSAMQAGADICVQSTHKQGGALQQGGMIHWNDERVNMDLLMSSYRSLTTTSPSFLLLASLDAAREMMEKKGEKCIDHILMISRQLAVGIDSINGFSVVDTKQLRKRNPSMYSRDESKILINVTDTGYTGYEIAKILERKYKIIVEKYNVNTILFLIPFRATLHDVQITINALKQITQQSAKKRISVKFDLKIPTKIPKILDLNDVNRLLLSQVEKVPLSQAEGRIAAENITPYPPGIPITIKGEEFTPEIIAYYSILKHYPNAHIVAQDRSLDTVWVVK